ncbi:serine/threonine-protein kinase [Streptomyces sp. LP11]|uniref:Serine/threonine-protein kinase n=1 Tax=Streptomyces pyxinicus TaxID=2970331 RepID=A0ABT2AXG2_9ACTN|nr:serine/threonine-protein kinase [Streptomyces sp. LP11]MCS0600941.1 serine/threonine-protein kinase [Streptomyces sp. LP11]
MASGRSIGAGAEAELPEYAGHYRLESCLGSGGMGVVHLARSTSGMRLAVKVVHAQFARDPEFRGRFRQEVAAARRVSGAFTASVVDADPDAERPWMATLFIPGPTLAQEVKRNGPLAPAQVRRLMAGLAEALRDIHRVGVVHRDLKPGNVLLAEDGPKVIDFGISRPKDSELRTETGKLIGTPPFMAPEQFRRPREVGPAADIFALGSVLVHAATGRGPFDSDSPYIVAYQVVHDEPDLTGLPESIAPLVLRCLAKEPEDRPTPDELMRELRSVAASYDTQAFIPAQRSGGSGGEEKGEEEAPSGSGDPGSGDSDVDRAVPRRRRWGGGKRAAAWGMAGLGLAVAAALGAARLSGAPGGHPAPDRSPRTVPAAAKAWATVPPRTGGTMAHCSYGAGKLLCSRTGVVFAVSPADGRLLWRHSVSTRIAGDPPVLSGGLVQPYTDGGTRLAALDPDSGKQVWERRLPQGTGVHYTGGTALFTYADGTVGALDTATGRTKWRHALPGGPEVPVFQSFPGSSSAYVARRSRDGSGTHVMAVDPVSGRVRWEADLSGSLSPVGADDDSVYLTAVDTVYGRTEAVVRYTPATREARRVPLPVGLDGAQGTVHGDRVYLLGAGGILTAVDMKAGKRVWGLETSVTRGSAPVTDGRRVFFSAADGRLLAVDAADGRLVGQTRARLGADADRVVASLPAPVLTGGRLYAAAPDGTVFSLDARDPSTW